MATMTMRKTIGKEGGGPVGLTGVSTRVVQVIHSPDPGGVLALADSVAAGLARHGFASETIFMTPRPGMSFAEKLKGAASLARRLMREPGTAVIAYQAGPSIVASLAGLLAGRRRTIIHQTTVPSATKAPVRWTSALLGTLGLYPVNVVNTAYTGDQFGRYPEAYRRRIKLIEHGVERPTVRQTRSQTLAKHAIPDDRRILLNTARLDDQKNQSVLVRALVALPDCRLVVAGDGQDRAAIEALAESLGVADRLHLLGALPHAEALELYGAADLFVFPSVHETFGISAVEAALLGLPTLVADIAVLREVLTIAGHSPVTFLDPDDSDAWARAIRKRIDAPLARTELDRFAAALGERYAPARMIDAYVALLKGER